MFSRTQVRVINTVTNRFNNLQQRPFSCLSWIFWFRFIVHHDLIMGILYPTLTVIMIFQQDQTPVIYSLYLINLVPSLFQAYFAWKKQTGSHYFAIKCAFVSVFSFHFIFGTIINCKVYYDFNGEQCQKSSLGVSIFFSLIVVMFEIALLYLLWKICKMGNSPTGGFSLVTLDRNQIAVDYDPRQPSVIEARGQKVDSSNIILEEIEDAVPLFEEKKSKGGGVLRRKQTETKDFTRIKLIDLTINCAGADTLAAL